MAVGLEPEGPQGEMQESKREPLSSQQGVHDWMSVWWLPWVTRRSTGLEKEEDSGGRRFERLGGQPRKGGAGLGGWGAAVG